MPVKNRSKPFTCPICQTSKKWGEMVKHIAYAGNVRHQNWRETHGFPTEIEFDTMKKYEPLLRITVFKEFLQ